MKHFSFDKFPKRLQAKHQKIRFSKSPMRAQHFVVRQTPSATEHRAIWFANKRSRAHVCSWATKNAKQKSRSTTILKAKHSDTIKILSIFNSEVEKIVFFLQGFPVTTAAWRNKSILLLASKSCYDFFPLWLHSLPQLTLMKITYLEFFMSCIWLLNPHKVAFASCANLWVFW